MSRLWKTFEKYRRDTRTPSSVDQGGFDEVIALYTQFRSKNNRPSQVIELNETRDIELFCEFTNIVSAFQKAFIAHASSATLESSFKDFGVFCRDMANAYISLCKVLLDASNIFDEGELSSDKNHTQITANLICSLTCQNKCNSGNIPMIDILSAMTAISKVQAESVAIFALCYVPSYLVLLMDSCDRFHSLIKRLQRLNESNQNVNYQSLDSTVNDIFDYAGQLLCALIVHPCSIDELIAHDKLKRLLDISLSPDKCRFISNVSLEFLLPTSFVKNFISSTPPSLDKIIRVIVIRVLCNPTSLSIQYIIDNANIKKHVKGLIRLLDPVKSPGQLEIVQFYLDFIRMTLKWTYKIEEEFRECDGYTMVLNTFERMFNCHQLSSSDLFENEHFNHLFESLLQLITSSHGRIKQPLFQSKYPFVSEKFKEISEPRYQGDTVQNLPAFAVLQSLFITVNDFELNKRIMKTIDEFLSNDPANYFILSKTEALSQLLQVIPYRDQTLQAVYMDMLLFLMTTLDYIIYDEMSCFVLLMLKADQTTSFLRCGIKFARRLVNLVERSVVALPLLGFLDCLVFIFRRFTHLDLSKHIEESVTTEEASLVLSTIELTSLLLAEQQSSIDLFRKKGGIQECCKLVAFCNIRAPSLHLLSQIVTWSHLPNDLSNFLRIVEGAYLSDIALRQTVLQKLEEMLQTSNTMQTLFRQIDGFSRLILIISSYHGWLSRYITLPLISNNGVNVDSFLLYIEQILSVLVAGSTDNVSNSLHIRRNIKWSSLNSALNDLIENSEVNSDNSSFMSNEIVSRPISHPIFEAPITLIEHSSLNFPIELESSSIIKEIFSLLRIKWSTLKPSFVPHLGRCVLIGLLFNACCVSSTTKSNSHINAQSNVDSVQQSHGFIQDNVSKRQLQQHVQGGDNSNTKLRPIKSNVHCSNFTLHFPIAYLCVFDQISQVLFQSNSQPVQDALVNFISGPLFRIATCPNVAAVLGSYDMMSMIIHSYSSILSTAWNCASSDFHIQMSYQTKFRLQLCILSFVEYLSTYGISTSNIRTLIRCSFTNEISRLRLHLVSEFSKLKHLPQINPITSKTLLSMITTILPSLTRMENADNSFKAFSCFVQSRMDFRPFIELQSCRSQTSSSMPDSGDAIDKTNSSGCLLITELCINPDDSYPKDILSSSFACEKRQNLTERILYGGQSGLTFCGWIQLPKHSPSYINLFSMVIQNDLSNNIQSVLNIFIFAKVKRLVVSLNSSIYSGISSTKRNAHDIVCARFDIESHLPCGEWKFVAISVGRGLLKSSTALLVIDDKLIGSKKMSYTSSVVQPLSMFYSNRLGSVNSPTSIDQSLRDGLISVVMGNNHALQPFITLDKRTGFSSRQSMNDSTYWRLTYCMLFAESLNLNYLRNWYVRTLQSFTGSTLYPTNLMYIPTANEDSIVWIFDPSFHCYTNVESGITRLGSLGKMNLMQCSTGPVIILPNLTNRFTAYSTKPKCNVQGECIPQLFAILQSNIPNPLILYTRFSNAINKLGGCTVILNLINEADCRNVVYSTLKSFFYLIETDSHFERCVMDCCAISILRLILYDKRNLLSAQVLHVVSTFCSTAVCDGSSPIQETIFDQLFTNFTLWKYSAPELQSSLFNQLNNCVQSSERGMKFTLLLNKVNILNKIFIYLRTLKSPIEQSVWVAIENFIFEYMVNVDKGTEYIKFAHFVLALIPYCTTETSTSTNNQSISWLSSVESDEWVVVLCNRCLSMIENHLKSSDRKSSLFIRNLLKFVGFDWFMLFFLPCAHRSVVVKAIKSVEHLLNINELAFKFEHGAYIGSWMHQIRSISISETSVLHAENKTVQFEFQYLTTYMRVLECSCVLNPNLVRMIPLLSRCFGINISGMALKSNTTCLSSNLDISKTSIASLFAPTLLTFIIRTFFQDSENRVEAIRLHDELRSVFQVNQVLIETFNMDIFVILVDVLFYMSESDLTLAEKRYESDSEDLTASSEFEVFRKSMIHFVCEVIIGHIKLNMRDELSQLFSILLSHRNESRFSHAITSPVISDLFRRLLQKIISEVKVCDSRDIESYLKCSLIVVDVIVSSIWKGLHAPDACEVFSNLVEIIKFNSSNQISPSVTLDFSRLLNRLILYVLSSFPVSHQPEESIVGLKNFLYALAEYKDLVFASQTINASFLFCLSYCIFKICSSDAFDERKSTNTTWHTEDGLEKFSNKHCQTINLHISRTCRQIWLYMCDFKQSVIEEAIKSLKGPKTHSVDDVKDFDQAIKILRQFCINHWISYIESEQKRQLESNHPKSGKITNFAQNLSKVITKRTIDVNKEVRETFDSDAKDYFNLQNNFRIAKRLWDDKMRQHREMDILDRIRLLNLWNSKREKLYRERGLLGPEECHALTRWQLDSTEGFSRMRRRLCLNDRFFDIYNQATFPESNTNIKSRSRNSHRCPSSWLVNIYEHCKATSTYELDSKITNSLTSVQSISELDFIYQHCIQLTSNNECLSNAVVTPPSILDIDPIEKLNSLFAEQNVSSEPHIPFLVDQKSSSDENLSKHDQTNVITHAASADCFRLDQRLAHLVDTNEQVLQAYSCKRVAGLSSVDGVFFVGQSHFYVIDGYTYHDGALTKSDNESADTNRRSCRFIESTQKICEKFAYENVTDVLKRRYLLQPLAIEIFSSNGLNLLLAFNKTDRDRIYSRLLSACSPYSLPVSESISGQRRGSRVEQLSTKSFFLSALFGNEKSVMQRWVNNEITNFEYLMYLNTIAGRTYNDLVQYPVFPWILADYDSEVLDLFNEKTFRDLRKPMGAQSDARFQQYEQRAREIENTHSNEGLDVERNSYHYNTHYSSAMIVAWYLARLEPFTTSLVNLQGGTFDLPDRAFHSIKECWLSASEKNMSDVKELIPEFFYLPDFLINSNRFNFGKKQNGDIVDDVQLPPWSKNDPREFIRLHRMALESDYVSMNLHHWIDLIFGYKQRGVNAFKAGNLFHPFFYEGTVDLDQITDPTVKDSISGFINNFGQIPREIFKKPHAQKKLSRNLLQYLTVPSSLYFFNVLEFVTRSPVDDIPGIDFVSYGLCFNERKALTAIPYGRTPMPQIGVSIDWVYLDGSIRVHSLENEKIIYSTTRLLSSTVLCCCSCCNDKLLVFGCLDCQASVWSAARIRLDWPILKANLNGHTSAVTAVCASDQYRIIFTGSQDCTVLMWNMNNFSLIRQLRQHTDPITCLAVHSLTGDVAVGCGTKVYYWTVNGDLMAHTDVAQLDGTQDCSSINTLVFSELAEWDDENVVAVGCSDGNILMLRLQMVQVPEKIQYIDNELFFNADEKVCQSTSNTDESAYLTCECISKEQVDFNDRSLEEIKTRRKSSSIEKDYVIVSDYDLRQPDHSDGPQNASLLASNPTLIAEWQANRMKSKFMSLAKGNRWERRLVLAASYTVLKVGNNAKYHCSSSDFSNKRPNNTNMTCCKHLRKDFKDGSSARLTHIQKTGVTAILIARDCRSFFAACSEKTLFRFSFARELVDNLRF